MHTFHRGEQNHMSALLTQWPKLWIFKRPDILKFHRQKGKKKMASQGYLNTSSLSCRRDFMNVLFFLSYNHFKWNYNHVSYGIVLPTQPNDTQIKARVHFIETEVKFIQASGSCWWLFRHFGVVRGPLWIAEVGEGGVRSIVVLEGEKGGSEGGCVCVPGQVLPPFPMIHW